MSVSQAGLIRLNGPARAIALDVLRVNSLGQRIWDENGDGTIGANDTNWIDD